MEILAPSGFPSPAQDSDLSVINLNDILVTQPSSTYFARASGTAMEDVGIFDQDILVVCRALNEQHGDVVVAAFEGELVCRKLNLRDNTLVPCSPYGEATLIHMTDEVTIEGVVASSVRLHRPVGE